MHSVRVAADHSCFTPLSLFVGLLSIALAGRVKRSFSWSEVYHRDAVRCNHSVRAVRQHKTRLLSEVLTGSHRLLAVVTKQQ